MLLAMGLFCFAVSSTGQTLEQWAAQGSAALARGDNSAAESAVRAAVPAATLIYLEPDLDRALSA